MAQSHPGTGIEWIRWGRTAFDTANQQGKPLFLYLHTAWGHSVHRFESEVLATEALRDSINERTVPVRVDALRRPDVFERYQQGGWPSVCLLSPTGALLYGTGATSPEHLLSAVEQVAQAWTERAEELQKQIDQSPPPRLPRMSSGEQGGYMESDSLDSIREDALAWFDTRYHGFGRAPKYSHPELLKFLLEDPSEDLRQLAFLSLETIRRSPLHDIVGGGFFRSCEDEAWRLPSFEKMLLDNLGLLDAFLEAYRQSRQEHLAKVASRLLVYIEANLGDPSGLLYAAQDGDLVPGDRAGYYGWTEQELRELGGDETEQAALLAYLGINPVSRIPGSSDRYSVEERVPLNQIAMRTGLPLDKASELIERGLEAMRRIRAQRNEPAVDAGFFVHMQGRALESLAQAAIVLERPRFLQRAFEIADILRKRARNEAGLMVHEVGETTDTAFLVDQVEVILGLLALYRVAGRAADLLMAVELAELTLDHLSDPEGIGCIDHKPREQEFGALAWPFAPFDANAKLLHAMAQLAALTGQTSWHERSLALLRGLEELRPGHRLQDAGYGRALRRIVTPPPMVDLLTGEGVGEMRKRLLLEAPSGTLIRAFDPEHATPWTPIERYPSNGAQARAVVHAGDRSYDPTHDVELTLLHLNEQT